MKTTFNGNIYGVDNVATRKKFAELLSGAANADTGSVLTLSMQTLTASAQSALNVSFDKLGYGTNAVTFAQLDCLSRPEQLIELVEGLDPLVVVFADDIARKLFESAYELPPLPLYTPATANCRRTLCLGDFEAALATPASKQIVWGALKHLSRA